MVIASVTHKPNEFNSIQTNRENGKTNRPKLGSNQSKFEARFWFADLPTPVKSPGRLGQSWP